MSRLRRPSKGLTVGSMTYCLGLLMREGLVLASDSRSNAGVDNITLVKKLRVYSVPGERVIVVLSAGNLATTQAVTGLLSVAQGSGVVGQDFNQCLNMFDAAQLLGDRLRVQIARDGEYVRAHGDPNATFIIGGQIKGEAPRLFLVYSAGNFVEITDRRPFAQTGETKYGKPILLRAFDFETGLDEAAKLALLSFDATIRSNLAVDAPVDLLRYRANSFTIDSRETYSADGQYWEELRAGFNDGLRQLVAGLPPPASPPR